jgi:hypothetical protein
MKINNMIYKKIITMSHLIKSFTIKYDPSQGIPSMKRRGVSRKSRKDGDEQTSGPVVTKIGGSQQVATAGVVPLGVKTQITGYTSPTMPGQGALSLQGAPTIHKSALLQVSGGAVAQDSDKKIHVELRKSATPKKVHLNPKKIHKPSEHQTNKTKKVRKITLGLSSMHKRVTRAKKIRDHVKEMPIDELRKELIKRGLIKETSKAPESILRQIASDAQIVGGNGL